MLLGGGNLFSQSNTYPSSGNVGIGTTTPLKSLHINGFPPSYQDPAIRLSYGVEIPYWGSLVLRTPGNFMDNPGSYSDLSIPGDLILQSSAQAKSIILTTRNYQGSIVFGTTPEPNVSDVERMSITPWGGVRISSLAGAGTRVVVADQIGFLSTQPSNFWGLQGNSGTNPTDFIGTTDNNDFVIKTNSTQNIQMNTGCVVIGQHGFTPVTGDIVQPKKLSVEGALIAKEILVDVTATKWADFVFNSDYKLMPLTEVEESIQENKRLPGIPSAEEMSKTGLNVANMDSKLLQKIEELTLYCIDLQKQCDELKSQLKKINQGDK